jgi:hypothetical protein
MPPTVGTSPEITDGCTKIDAPMIVPTTSAVARSSPMGRGSWACELVSLSACEGALQF